MKKLLILFILCLASTWAIAEPYLFSCNDFAHTQWQGFILPKNNKPRTLTLTITNINTTPVSTFLDANFNYNGKNFKTTGWCFENDAHKATSFSFEIPILHVDIGTHNMLLNEQFPDGKNLLSNLRGEAVLDDGNLHTFYAGQLSLSQ